MNTRDAIADLEARWAAADLVSRAQRRLGDANELDRARAWAQHGPRTATGRRSKMPSRRDRALARLPIEVVDQLERRAKRRLELYARVVSRECSAYHDERQRLLRAHVPEQCDRYHVVETVGCAEYRSQGFGAAHYARGRAQRDVDALLAAGIDAFVAEVSPIWARPRPSGGPSCLTPAPAIDMVVNARCMRLDLLAARLREPVDMAELVRRCWARGVNPRVYWPLLEHDFEARHGIDHQGRRVAQGAT